MPRTVMRLVTPVLKVATTQAGLTAGQAVQCQVTSAVVTAEPQYVTIPATGCAGASQSPGTTSYSLVLDYLQDWAAGAALSLSVFAFNNDAKLVWFELTPDAAVPTTKLVGSAYCSAGDFGGTFGDGSAATSTSTWPLTAIPTITQPVVLAADVDADVEPAESELVDVE